MVGSPLVCDAGPYRVGLEANDDGGVTSIWIDVDVPNAAELVPKFTVGTDGIHTLTAPPIPFDNGMVEILQYLESMGAFWLGVVRIGWGDASREWIPETDADRDLVTVTAMSSSEDYRETPVLVDAALVGRILATKAHHEYLTVPLSFHREGMNEYRAHRYVSAFSNFYYFIEGLYGNGKTKNYQVLEAFKRSKQLLLACGEAWRTLADSPEIHLSELASLGYAAEKQGDPEAMLAFLVKIRGDLHHYSTVSSRPKGHPLNHRQFRSPAFMALAVCIPLVAILSNGVPLQADGVRRPA